MKKELQIIKPEKLKIIDDEVKKIVLKASKITVKSQEDVAEATVFLGALKGEIRDIEKARKDLTQPLNDTIKKINNTFRMRNEPMQKVEAVLKGKIKTFLDEEDAKAREEAQRLQKIKEEAERKAQEEADKKARKAEEARQKVENAKNATAKKKAEEAAKKAEEAAQKAEAEKEAIANKVVEVEESPKNVRTEGGLMSTKKVWKFEVTDEAKVPKEFWVIDQKKINEAVKNGERELPGVRIFQDTQISIR